MTGSHKCTNCGKVCKTNQAMAQHMRDKHSAVAPKGQRARSARPKQRAGGAGASVSTPLSVVNKAVDQTTASGTDRVFHTDDLSALLSGSVVCQIPIEAGTFARMAVLARAYQRVEYIRLNFRVSTYAPTSVGGGYVAAFVADPDDVAPAKAQVLNWLTSQQGSVTTKWWQNATIAARPARSWYYTSPGVEVREFSPGRFVIVVDVRASATTGLTVWADWQVKLTRATLESAPTLRTITAAKPLYTQAGHKGLFWKSGDTFKDDNDTMFPGWKQDMVLICSPPLVVTGGAAQSSAVLRTVWWLRFTGPNDLKFCYEKAGFATEDVAGSELLAVREGTSFELYSEPQIQGEVQGPSGLTSAGATCSSTSQSGLAHGTISQCQCSSINNSLSTFAVSLTNVSRQLQMLAQLGDLSRLMAPSKLTESPHCSQHLLEQCGTRYRPRSPRSDEVASEASAELDWEIPSPGCGDTATA